MIIKIGDDALVSSTDSNIGIEFDNNEVSELVRDLPKNKNVYCAGPKGEEDKDGKKPIDLFNEVFTRQLKKLHKNDTDKVLAENAKLKKENELYRQQLEKHENAKKQIDVEPIPFNKLAAQGVKNEPSQKKQIDVEPIPFEKLASKGVKDEPSNT